MDNPENGSETVRNSKGQFTKGNSGGGRIAMTQEVKDMLRSAAPDAVKLLVETVKDESVQRKLRIDAANTILDRVYGKASQPIEGSMDNTISIMLSKELKEYAE